MKKKTWIVVAIVVLVGWYLWRKSKTASIGTGTTAGTAGTADSAAAGAAASGQTLAQFLGLS